MKIVIVGGVAGGASAAARLRRLNEKAEIIILERGGYVSFANCGLPYYISGMIPKKENLTVQTPESLKARFQIDVRVNNEVTEIDPKSNTVTVRDLKTGETYLESYNKLILSPGAEPVTPPIPGADSEQVFTLRNIPDTLKIKVFLEEKKPKSAVIVGGGAIGIEMAENLKKAGLDVTIVEMADHLIASLDFDMAADVQRYLRSKGIRLILRNGVKAIDKEGSHLKVALKNGSVCSDMLLMSVGVRPDTDLAEKCGIRVDSRGAVLTDAHMQTSVHDIYAVGDAVETVDFITGNPTYVPLAGPANKQGRIAADNICGFESEYSGTQGSSIIKAFEITAASTGLNEKSAEAAGINYDKTYLYLPSHASYYPGASNMSIKALWNKKTFQLLGAQIVGFDGVDKRIDVLASAIRFGAKVTDLAGLELCYAPPFSSAKDPVNMLGFVAENIITGKVRQFFWDDVESLPRDGSVTLLDVRTKTEVARGKISGFRNIPLDSLRKHLDKIPKDKPVYLHCHSGLRSYIACRILAGYGYDCYNLAGGWRLYESVVHERTVPEYVCTECK